MKKIFPLVFSTLTVPLFAQDTVGPSLSTSMASVSNHLGFDIISILIAIFFYVFLPIALYCIGSYSLALLNKHYNKKITSRISWIPFIRYYDFVKQVTKSPKKAFIITLLPWITTVIGILGGLLIGIVEKSIGTPGWSPYAVMTFGILIVIGILGIVVMSFWRAFIITKYVKGDVTTALGLSTYTALVLWYIALDRVYKKTNIIGILGFILLGTIVCFYIGILSFMGVSGIATFLGN